MALTPGTTCGSYEVLSLIGEGGMGQVFRARDTKLKRDVALKALPEEFSSDAERVSRFRREAEALAALSHPHIAGIHDLAEAGGTQFLVLELVEGETLAERLRRGPLSLDEALIIAQQIAEALETAHERGIVHRDLKPSNIKIAPDGRAKVLDFGLAKIHESSMTAVSLSQSPTVMTGTALGVILGTAAYMSPEQAKGKPADRTSDVWAFGCVFYEMLTGRPAFDGETVGELLGEIFKQEPDWTRLPAATPPAIRRLLRRCLHKDRVQRLHDMADARLEIEDARREPSDGREAAPARSRRTERLGWMAAALFAVAAAAALVLTLRPSPTPPELRVDINTPQSPEPISIALSPDGQNLVYVGAVQGFPRLWLRPLAAPTATPLAGTEGASRPFWSPDGRSLGFFADGRVKRIDIPGGSPRSLANASFGLGGAWNNDGVILFAANVAGPIFRTTASGGIATVAATHLAPPAISHRMPQFLPDGRHFLFFAINGPQDRAIYVGSLDGAEPRRLLDADAAPVQSMGHLLFVQQGALMAQRFDADRRVLMGDPFRVVEQVAADISVSGAALSASARGTIAYRVGAAAGRRQLLWFERTGRQISALGTIDQDTLNTPEISPDGRFVALDRRPNRNRDVWIIESSRGVISRFTFDTGDDAAPIWAPDGSQVFFCSNRKGAYDLYRKPANGNGNEELLLESLHNKVPTDVSRDGRFLLYRDNDPDTGYDVWALPLTEGRKPFPLVKTAFTEGEAQLSPDGKWIAYRSNESGRFEVYVQPFPGPGGKVLVSPNGGAQPRWGRDGHELFYVALDGRLMAAPVRGGSSGGAVEIDTPVALFTTRIPGGALQGINKQQYIVSPDGQRFLINTLMEEDSISPISLILNWRPPAPSESANR